MYEERKSGGEGGEGRVRGREGEREGGRRKGEYKGELGRILLCTSTLYTITGGNCKMLQNKREYNKLQQLRNTQWVVRGIVAAEKILTTLEKLICYANTNTVVLF